MWKGGRDDRIYARPFNEVEVERVVPGWPCSSPPRARRSHNERVAPPSIQRVHSTLHEKKPKRDSKRQASQHSKATTESRRPRSPNHATQTHEVRDSRAQTQRTREHSTQGPLPHHALPCQSRRVADNRRRMAESRLALSHALQHEGERSSCPCRVLAPSSIARSVHRRQRRVPQHASSQLLRNYLDSLCSAAPDQISMLMLMLQVYC